jgi:hypothetical protein
MVPAVWSRSRMPGRVSRHRGQVAGRRAGRIGPVQAGEQRGAGPPVTAGQRQEGGAQVRAGECVGGAGVGPEEHRPPHQIRPCRGERGGNRSGLGHGEQDQPRRAQMTGSRPGMTAAQ